MAETTQILFSHKELVTALIKDQGIHDGIWGIYVNFGIQGLNAGPSANEIVPAALVPIVNIGIQKFEAETNISVDASKVNPSPSASPPPP